MVNKLLKTILVLSKIFIFITIINYFPSRIQTNASDYREGLYITEIAHLGTISSDNCKISESAKVNCNHDKWIEIYNYSPEPINLSNYTLLIGRQKENFQKAALKRNLPAISIDPYQTLIILNKNKTMRQLLSNMKYSTVSIGGLFALSNNGDNGYVSIGISDKQGSIIQLINENYNSIGVDSYQNIQSKNTLEIGIDGQIRIGLTYFSEGFKASPGKVRGFPTINKNQENTSNKNILKPVPKQSNVVVKTKKPINIAKKQIPGKKYSSTSLLRSSYAMHSYLKIPRSYPINQPNLNTLVKPRNLPTLSLLDIKYAKEVTWVMLKSGLGNSPGYRSINYDEKTSIKSLSTGFNTNIFLISVLLLHFYQVCNNSKLSTLANKYTLVNSLLKATNCFS